MLKSYLYTNLEDAESDVAYLNQVNNSLPNGCDWVSYPRRLTADPEIGGVVYLYDIERPSESSLLFRSIDENEMQFGAIEEYDSEWILQEEA